MIKEVSANTQLSHYRVLSKIGAGGMGEVYLAEDTRLFRKVALKLLPAGLTADPDRVRRFAQEAKAASALNHPNIITIHDIGESEAGHFIVMELVSGRPVSDTIATDNSIETLVALGSQMAKALSAAHAAGITHRDIKPDNIMVRDDGYVKVLDFGLARLLPTGSGEDAATLAQQTMPGMIMGTVAYMSPEQASGQSVGQPSDIFALGIVFYELATGRHPFHADTLVGYLQAITLQSPVAPSSLKPGIPAALDQLILQMLEKDPSRRPSADEIAVALLGMEKDARDVRTLDSETMILPVVHSSSESPVLQETDVRTTTSDDGFWVAVLPFRSRNTNTDLDALAEGLSEEIITGLSRFSYLRVIGRGSTLRYANQGADLRVVGKELGARYVMEGSLRQAGTKLRVAVQLVDARTGAGLWAENYERGFSAETLFELQDDLVPRIVSTVADQYGALVHSMSESLRGRSPGQYSAHEAMLRFFGYLERMTPEEHREVREILEAAVAAAPDHSGCQAALSVIYWTEYANSYNVRPDPLGRAHAAAQQAVAVGPTNHNAHSTLASVLFFQKDFLACRLSAERTLALNPMDASTTALLGTLIAYSGEWEYGLSVMERAMQLNPNYPGWYHFPAVNYAYHSRDYRGALEIALKINMPGYFFMYTALAAVCGQLGELDRARAALRDLHALVPHAGAIVREEYDKWFDAEFVDHMMDGLRKAGLEVVDTEPQPRKPAPAGESM